MFIDSFATPIGLMEIGAERDHIVSVRFIASEPVLCKKSSLIDSCKNQLAEYLLSTRTTFDLPLKLTGSPFQMAVWTKLQSIPFGQTVSYQEVAESLANPQAQRAVGSANGKNKLALLVPCHRIINKDGGSGGYAYGVDKKEWLLRHEKRKLKTAGY